MLFLNKKVRFKNGRFPCFDDVINIMLALLTDKVPFFSYFSNILLFDTEQEKLKYLLQIELFGTLIR